MGGCAIPVLAAGHQPGFTPHLLTLFHTCPHLSLQDFELRVDVESLIGDGEGAKTEIEYEEFKTLLT